MALGGMGSVWTQDWLQGHLRAKLPARKEKDLFSHILLPYPWHIFEVKLNVGGGTGRGREKAGREAQDQELLPFSLLF